MSSIEPDCSAGEVHGGAEIFGGFVVAGGDGAELLEPAEEVLDQVARLVAVAVKFGRVLRFDRDGMTAALPAAANGWRTRLSASKARSAISRVAVICGSSASAPTRSCACPGVSRRANGRPRASTRAWIFVLSPPRLRPMACVSSFFGRAGAVLMGPHDGAVDYRVFVVGIGGQMLKHPRFCSMNHINCSPGRLVLLSLSPSVIRITCTVAIIDNTP